MYYTFNCKKCGEIEFKLKPSDIQLKKCTKCKCNKIERVFQAKPTLLTLEYAKRYEIVCCMYFEEPNIICLETKEGVYKWLEKNKEILIRYDNFIMLTDRFTNTQFYIDADEFTTSSAIEKEVAKGFKEVLDA